MTRLHARLLGSLALAGALVALAGCPKPRTSAMPFPGVAPYDPSGSDPKAVALADAMLAKLGGAETWDKLQQIRWKQRVEVGGEVRGLYGHSWDRWNGRHRFEITNLASYRKAQEANDPDLQETSVAMYEVFDRQGKGVASHNGQEVMKADRDKMVADAYVRWLADAYLITLPYRVREQGAKLTLEPERPKDDYCPDTCDVIKIVNDPSVAKETFYLNILRSTGLPHMVEVQEAGKQGRIAYYFQDWTEAGGLKFAGKLKNVAADEVWLFTDIKVGEAEDDLYIPQIR